MRLLSCVYSEHSDKDGSCCPIGMLARKFASPQNGVQHSNKEHTVNWHQMTESVGVEDLEEMARDAGLLAAGQKMSPQLLAYTQAVVEQCACIADAYPPSETEESAAEHIRAMLPA